MSNNSNSNSNTGRNIGIAAGAAILGAGVAAGLYYLYNNPDILEGSQPEQRVQNQPRRPNSRPPSQPQVSQRQSSEDVQRSERSERRPAQNAQSTSSFRRPPFPRESGTSCVICNEETKRENRLILKCSHIMHYQCYNRVCLGHGPVCPDPKCRALYQ